MIVHSQSATIMICRALLSLAVAVGGASTSTVCPNHTMTLGAAHKRAEMVPRDANSARHNQLPTSTTASAWVNSSAGVHSWLVFDYHVSPANATAMAGQFDFVWGSSPAHAPAWRRGNPGIIVSRYINGNRDSTHNTGNLSWWRLHHPEWVMWTCQNSSGQRSVAWSNNDFDVMPLDWANPAVVKYVPTSPTLPPPDGRLAVVR